MSSEDEDHKYKSVVEIYLERISSPIKEKYKALDEMASPESEDALNEEYRGELSFLPWEIIYRQM